ncbi:hypothetical protein FB45DRAFT_904377 [Roridomyces roridus]|uniref:Uncharacterized protein n=1 Tax=Roridomyces roridus TaxID=1738132 RepID=A0AAD7C4W4_9AGAR|nr:hypothetical protein FB45DRAFT_904377 [Roridomyces roridus]
MEVDSASNPPRLNLRERISIMPPAPANYFRSFTSSLLFIIFTTMPTPSRRPRHLAPPMTIDVQLADQGHRVRPLPTPPSPLSAPPAPSPKLGSSPSRPLPSLPETDVFASEPPPSPPRSAPIESNPILSRGHRRPGPPRISSLALRSETRLDEEKCYTPWDSSPTTPTLPEPPTPRTAQRNRVSKLRRHLGESVQMQLVMCQPDVLPELCRDGKGKEDLYPSIVVDSDSDSLGSSGSNESEGCSRPPSCVQP